MVSFSFVSKAKGLFFSLSYQCSNTIPCSLTNLSPHSSHTFYYHSFLLKTAPLCISSLALVQQFSANPLSYQFYFLVSHHHLKEIQWHYLYYFPASECNISYLLKWYHSNPKSRIHLKCKYSRGNYELLIFRKPLCWF